jgi:t-SNARE complex subunit (syntaxin)
MRREKRNGLYSILVVQTVVVVVVVEKLKFFCRA